MSCVRLPIDARGLRVEPLPQNPAAVPHWRAAAVPLLREFAGLALAHKDSVTGATPTRS